MQHSSLFRRRHSWVAKGKVTLHDFCTLYHPTHVVGSKGGSDTCVPSTIAIESFE